MRLVDADVAPLYLNKEACEQIKLMRTVDPVHAAGGCYCRECVYYKICEEWDTGKRMLCEIHHHSYLGHDGDEYFCSWGQRKEADLEVSKP